MEFKLRIFSQFQNMTLLTHTTRLTKLKLIYYIVEMVPAFFLSQLSLFIFYFCLKHIYLIFILLSLILKNVSHTKTFGFNGLETKSNRINYIKLIYISFIYLFICFGYYFLNPIYKSMLPNF